MLVTQGASPGAMGSFLEGGESAESSPEHDDTDKYDFLQQRRYNDTVRQLAKARRAANARTLRQVGHGGTRHLPFFQSERESGGDISIRFSDFPIFRFSRQMFDAGNLYSTYLPELRRRNPKL